MDAEIIEIDDNTSIQPKNEILDLTILEFPTNTSANEVNMKEIEVIPSETLSIPESTTRVTRSKKKYPLVEKKRLNEEIGCKNGEPHLSFYARQKLIQLLQNTYMVGNPDAKDALTIKLNHSPSQAAKVVEYIDCQAKLGKKHAELDNNDESFVRITEWVKFLHHKHMNDISGNELPLLFKLIANMEQHPKPVEIGDIDLQELYIFIANIMLGYPAKTPTGATGRFLHETFKSIISEMNTGSHDIQPLDEQLKKSNLIADPVSTDNFNLEELRLFLCNSSTNPFNFAFEFLNLNHFENIFGNSGSV